MTPGLLDPEHYRWSWYALPTFAASALTLGMGMFVLRRERASKAGFLFFLCTLFVFVWLFTFSWMYCSGSEAVALRWGKYAYFGVPFIPSAIYHFTLHVLNVESRPAKRLAWFSWTGSGCFSALIVGSASIIDGVYLYPWGYYPHYTAASAPYLLFFFGMMFASLALYWSRSQALEPGSLHERRIESLSTAFAVVYLASVDYLPKFGVGIYPFGYVPVIVFLCLSARAAWHYRFTDVLPAVSAEQIIATMNEPLVICDAYGFIGVANRAFAALSGWSEKELAGRPFEDLLDPKERGRLPSRMRMGSVEYDDYAFRTREGKALTVSLSAAPLKRRFGAAAGSVVVCRDVTERRLTERQLHTLNETLEQRVKERTEELQEKINELEWLNEVLMGREERIIELKQEIRQGGPR